METETWPNLLAEANRAQIPMVLVNARLSEKSRAKARWNGLVDPRNRGTAFSLVLAQTEADAGPHARDPQWRR